MVKTEARSGSDGMENRTASVWHRVAAYRVAPASPFAL
jgi:hypothetical protein